MTEIRLNKLREYLKSESLSGMIIPSNDPHFGEYIQDYYKVIKWLSGFSGEAGTLAVTLEEAALWTDSRFFLQAESQLAGSGIVLKRMKTAGCESIEEWMNNRLAPGMQVCVDQDLYSVSSYRALKKSLSPLDLVAVKDPFTVLWDERGSVRAEKIRILEEKITGESTRSKHSRMVSSLGMGKDFLYLVSACDDIAWLCNIRGNDVEYNPVPLVYAAVTKDKVSLFIREESLTEETKTALLQQGVDIREYDDFDDYISEYPLPAVRVASPEKLSVCKYMSASSKGSDFMPDTFRGGIISNLKARKNETEINGFRKAMLMDGVAWVRMWIWLEKMLSEKEVSLTEGDISRKLSEYRAESREYLGESFAPISAYGANAAMPHYETDEINPVKLAKKGLLLLDTGGQYLSGTTDTTRTIALGELSSEQIKDYTLVLRGMIKLSMAKFPAGTRGSQLDFLARGEVCRGGKIYLHGTGHGIGHALCVHEGPQSIRMEENPVALEPGMVMSDEPAVYVEGEYGIRTENTILCHSWQENQWGDFLQFETLTLVPVDKAGIDKTLLGRECILWLNDYHRRVRAKLSPFLTEEESAWLAVKTSDLD